MVEWNQKPVVDKRHFRPGRYYSDIDWNDFAQAVNEFQKMIEEWYVKPAEVLRKASPHFGFPIMALNCVLIDTLSQYYCGEKSSSPKTFKDFVRSELPAFKVKLRRPVPYKYKRRDKKLKDYADVLYHCFRCGIMHEAHIPPCAMMNRSKRAVVTSHLSGYYAAYSDGSKCPSVNIDPHRLLKSVKAVLSSYVAQLLDSNPRFEPRRANFRKKFKASFGIDIGHSFSL
jgi:hypothetical protein